MLSNLGFIIFWFPKSVYQSLYAKYETPKLIIAEGIICIGVNPFRTSSIIFANTAPIAPYGPNNRPKTNNNPTWGLCIPNSKNCIDENGDVQYEGVSLMHPRICSAILCNYSKLKQDSYDKFDEDMWYLIYSFEEIL